MEAAVETERFAFVHDAMGEEIQNLGYELGEVMTEESPLRSLQEVWNDKDIRDRYPEAIDVVGELDAAIVLGRLTALFGSVVIDEGDIEGVGFMAPFLVYRAGDEGGTPIAIAIASAKMEQSFFACISFDEADPGPEAVAREFWLLVFDDLTDLGDEAVRVLDAEAGEWTFYGVDEGKAFIKQEDADEDDLAEYESEPYGQDRYDYDDGHDDDEC